jgi:putative addiction module component (TIGR02574 family)
MDPRLVDQEGPGPELTQEQAEELDRRLAAHRQSPEDVIPWEHIKDEISQKY